MARRLSLETTLHREGEELRVTVFGELCRAEPEVGYGRDYVEIRDVFDAEGVTVALSPHEEDCLAEELLERA